jgi:thioredoxin 1
MTATVRPLASRGELDVLIASGAALAIDFAGPGDAASAAFSAMFDRVTARLPGMVAARCVLPDAAELAALFGIAETPALVLFRRGVGLYAGPATFPEAQLEALLRRALALDMDDVLRDMSDERASVSQGSHANMTCPTVRRGPMPA